MDKARRLLLGFFTAFALCKYSQAEWNATKEVANKTVSCGPHSNNNNCSDSRDTHTWSGHFSKCPKEYKHYCIHGICRFVHEQNTPSCRCDSGYIGSRCEYLDFAWLIADPKHIAIICVIAVLVILLLIIMVICIFVHSRHKLCRRKKKKKEEKTSEIEKLHTLNTNEAPVLSAETSI